jgi:hypothetical protein
LQRSRRPSARKKTSVEFDQSVDFKKYKTFIVRDGQVQTKASQTDAKQKILWPQNKKPQHWSGLQLSDRVKQIKAPFEQIYALEYSRLSWYAHPGLTGIANLPPEAFTYTCSYAFKLAVDGYWEILRTMIRRFKIAKANEKIERKMEVARMLPFTDDPQQVEVLLNSIR